jgi:hypothetical protein
MRKLLLAFGDRSKEIDDELKRRLKKAYGMHG